MDFSIPNEDLAFATTFEGFCQTRIAPLAAQVDATGRIPRESFAALAEIGFTRALFPEEAGGAGASWLTRALLEESLAKACASTYLTVGASAGLCGGAIWKFGSKAQQDAWLRPLMHAERIGCLAITEPSAGSDVSAVQTRAVKHGGTFRMTGEKALITNAPVADVAVVLASTNPEAGARGLTLFVVDLKKKGVERTRAYQKLGVRGSPTGGLRFEDVELSVDDVLGEEGRGFQAAMAVLEAGRIGMCHFALGVAEAAYLASCKYVGERKVNGRPIARLQAVHFKIADMKVELDGARLLARKAAWMQSTGGRHASGMVSAAKLFCTEMAMRVTDAAVQLHGGWGYTDDFCVERLFRDARLGPIGEGTSDIQRELIARDLLGE